MTGSTGTLFLAGIVVGAVALAGLSLLLAGARRTAPAAAPPAVGSGSPVRRWPPSARTATT